MTLADLRRALENSEPGPDASDFDLNPDRRRLVTEPYRDAAVLVPIFDRPEGLSILLTLRSDSMTYHPGQISFPGGRVDRDDDSLAAAALREAFEEVGIPPGNVDLIGELAKYRTGTLYVIHPIVGVVRPDFHFAPQPDEVAEVFELPLREILDPENHVIETGDRDGTPIYFYVIEIGQRRIWGATAAILVSMSRQLGLRS
jgi:8-oxo-dGTP pyrophosphatase MutT (NUDIX family)